jgi:hypothetical protein
LIVKIINEEHNNNGEIENWINKLLVESETSNRKALLPNLFGSFLDEFKGLIMNVNNPFMMVTFQYGVLNSKTKKIYIRMGLSLNESSAKSFMTKTLCSNEFGIPVIL